MSLPSDRLARSTVGGDVDLDLANATDRFEFVEIACEKTCSSGEGFAGRYRGIGLADLFDAFDPDTTHLLVESADGFRVCVSIRDASDGVLALERLDTRAGPDELPRLVSPSLSATRFVRNVATIEGRRLSSSIDPGTLERLRR